MNTPLTRRLFLASAASFAAGSSLLALTTPLLAQQKDVSGPGADPKPKAPAKPPALPLDKVQAVVGSAHGNLEKVMALVEETPLLANASWDWGGGDFETPLQAAAHTGRRAIAEYLLSRNARLDLYAAGMLGQLDYIKAVLALNPHAHEIPGPHGFTLLHCAKQGGDTAKPVYDWLIAQGVPEVFQRPLPYIWPAGTAPAKA
jgi:hypothetical protein